MTHNEISSGNCATIDRVEAQLRYAKATGLFTEEGCEALVSYMDDKRRQEEHNERLQAIRTLSELGD